MMMKLFAIYIGGEHPGANIEVHDMRFVVAPSIEETYDTLLREWWGKPGSLHLDCWSEISHADGYEVTLKPEPFEGAEQLYYVNLGGYDGRDFAEKHRNVFVVADTVAKAKSRAIKLAKGWDAPHRDEMYEAEQAFALDAPVSAQRLHIHLTPKLLSGDPPFTCEYRPLK
ncbi:DUF1543 domain-containing protein [Brevundimonas sp.]|uniref:DUF1543 domain-containing protein n=1 Tax=Brevundimonas sp. TaxID=1871086 RepID=UPI003BAD4584